jgi:hypothetical protein
MSDYNSHYLDAHLHILWVFTIKSNEILERIAARPIDPWRSAPDEGRFDTNRMR